MKLKNALPNNSPAANTKFYILLALYNPQDGQGIMQLVEEISAGEVRLAPGTIYGVLNKLEKDGLIARLECQTSNRRNLYELTSFGKQIVRKELDKWKMLIDKYDKAFKEVE